MRSGRERGNLLSKLTVHFAKAVPCLFFTPDKMQVVVTFFIFTLIASTVYLTHFALTYEQSLTGGVPDMQKGAFFCSAQPDYERSHGEVFGVCVKEHHVAIFDGPALHCIITHGVCWAELGADLIDWNFHKLVFGAVAILRHHLQHHFCLCDVHHAVDDALDHELLATTPRATY